MTSPCVASIDLAVIRLAGTEQRSLLQRGSHDGDGCSGRRIDRGYGEGGAGGEADVYHVVDVGVHDDGVGGESAVGADDGRLWAGVRVLVSGSGDRVSVAAVAGGRGVGVGMVGWRVPVG